MLKRDRPRLFISSARGTQIDQYRDEAAKVAERLGFEPVWMEENTPGRLSPREYCAQEVSSCDAIAILVGEKYGSSVPETEISYTEFEYDTALSRSEMEILIWVSHPDHLWSSHEYSRGEDACRLDRFKERIAAHTRSEFESLAGFTSDFTSALIDLRARLEVQHPMSSVAMAISARTRLTSPDVFAKPAYAGKARFTGREAQMAQIDEWAKGSEVILVLEAIGGTGKSALAWNWFSNRSEEAIEELAGRFWWSFYDSSNTLTKFLQQLLEYTTNCPSEQAGSLEFEDLRSAVLSALSESPFLVVMDGFERLLNAYHRFDAGIISESELDAIADSKKNGVTDHRAYTFLRDLASIGSSKILITSRLMPDALEGFGGVPLPGVEHSVLPGLSTDEAIDLLTSLGVIASRTSVQTFFGKLDNHPLLIGLVAGMVKNYRQAPGNLDAWLADPAHGGSFHLSDVSAHDLSDRILKQAMDRLGSEELAILQSISLTPMAAPWWMVQAANPYLPDAPFFALDYSIPDYIRKFVSGRDLRRRSEKALDPQEAEERMVDALDDLQERGLLWWNRDRNEYDMHPVVRSYVYEQTPPHLCRATNETWVARGSDGFGRELDQESKTVNSVDDLLPLIASFRILVGAGLLTDAKVLWREQLRDHLRALEENLVIIQLLAPLAQLEESYPNNYDFTWDLANALSEVDKEERAIDLFEGLVEKTVIPERDLGNLLAALNNLGSMFDDLGMSSMAHTYFEILGEFTESSNEESDQLRVRLLQFRDLMRAKEYTRALELNESLLAHSGYPRMQFWHERRLFDRDIVTVTMGHGTELGEVQLEQCRYGTHPVARSMWAVFVAFYAREFGLYDLLHTAGLDVAHRSSRSGREPISADVALALAGLGQKEESRAELDSIMSRWHRVQSSKRPYYTVACALKILEDLPAARDNAVKAYRQAWEQGPPWQDQSKLESAARLCQELGVSLPDLPTEECRLQDTRLGPELMRWLSEIKADRASEDSDER